MLIIVFRRRLVNGLKTNTTMANEILDLTAELIAVSDPWLKVSRNAKKGIVLPEVVVTLIPCAARVIN